MYQCESVPAARFTQYVPPGTKCTHLLTCLPPFACASTQYIQYGCRACTVQAIVYKWPPPAARLTQYRQYVPKCTRPLDVPIPMCLCVDAIHTLWSQSLHSSCNRVPVPTGTSRKVKTIRTIWHREHSSFGRACHHLSSPCRNTYIMVEELAQFRQSCTCAPRHQP